MDLLKYIILMLILTTSVLAITPQASSNYRNHYNITNVNYFNASIIQILGHDVCLDDGTNCYFNQSLTDTLYYPKNLNPLNYYNDSTFPFGIISGNLTSNGNSSWNQSYANTLYYNIDNPFGYYNSSNFAESDPLAIQNASDTLGNGFLFKSGYNATLNMSALDARYMSGGVRVYWFTNQTNTAGTKNMTLTQPTSSMTIITQQLNDVSEHEVVSFITQKQSAPVFYVAGMRYIYLATSVADAGRTVEWKARVYLCENYNEVTDTCGTLTSYTNSTSFTDDSTGMGVSILDYYVANIYSLNISNRFMVKIYVKKITGGNTAAHLYVDDGSYSRIQVPSPIGSTDLSNYYTKQEVYNMSESDVKYYPKNSNPLGYYNSSTLPPAGAETDPLWQNNATLFANKYNSTNFPWATITGNASTGGNSSWNESYAYTLFLNKTSEANYLSTFNSTYDAKISYNTSFNQSLTDNLYVKKTGDTMQGNLNMSNYNITTSSGYSEGFNGTCWIRQIGSTIDALCQ